MTREDILRMAHEANLCGANGEDSDSVNIAGHLERFLALAIAAKDAEHQQTLALQQRSYEREIQLEVEAEREACAKLCEDYDDDRGTGETWGPRFAAIIRARTP